MNTQNISKKNQILNIITNIRESFYGSIFVYTNGSCYQFFKILNSIYPEAEACFKDNHIVSKIDGKYYDINGEINDDFIPLNEVDSEIIKSIVNNKYGVSGYIECPNCYDVFKVKE